MTKVKKTELSLSYKLSQTHLHLANVLKVFDKEFVNFKFFASGDQN